MHEIPVFVYTGLGLSLASAAFIACSVGLFIGTMYAIELVLRVSVAIIVRFRRRRP